MMMKKKTRSRSGREEGRGIIVKNTAACLRLAVGGL